MCQAATCSSPAQPRAQHYPAAAAAAAAALPGHSAAAAAAGAAHLQAPVACTVLGAGDRQAVGHHHQPLLSQGLRDLGSFRAAAGLQVLQVLLQVQRRAAAGLADALAQQAVCAQQGRHLV
jgi:hypothetical protein